MTCGAAAQDAGLIIGFVLSLAAPSFSQTPKPTEAQTPKALRLALSGRCAEALPLLRNPAIQTPKFRRDIQMAGARCAMTLNRPADALPFAAVLQKEFPADPEILYFLTHLYSDLSVRISQELLMKAPASAQVRELNAEAMETQGQWDGAIKEYEAVLAKDPQARGIHFRIGRVLLSKQPMTPDQMDRAKTEFEAELKIDPEHAGANFVLGELMRREDKFDEAIAYFTKAAQYDAGNPEAFLGLGRSLVAAERYKEAIPPLETAVKLQPENPQTHYQLAIAYGREGRKEESAREAAMHRDLLAGEQKRKDEIQRGVQGMEPR
jgi:tetratricopeptide (TPR) repeat protein